MPQRSRLERSSNAASGTFYCRNMTAGYYLRIDTPAGHEPAYPGDSCPLHRVGLTGCNIRLHNLPLLDVRPGASLQGARI